MKRYFRLWAVVTALILCLSLFSACGKSDESAINTGWKPNEAKIEVASDSLYVKKVENLPADFIMGMDASCVPALEASGVNYYDYDGTEKDVYEILRNNGILQNGYQAQNQYHLNNHHCDGCQ